MKEELEFYKSYHSNDINKSIHFVCIPMIILSIMIFLKDFYVLYERNTEITKEKINKNYKIPILDILITLYTISYMSITLEIGFVMISYFFILKFLSIIIIDNNYIWISKYLFIYGWIFQFVGHYIEGRRPALFDSLSQAFYQAPLFSLEYIMPFLFNF
tara:strand:+ start:397 stop:873 length:477 start_codon:yes stop_codon:yes gene_type:complete